jgi:hypothetical protein
MKAANLRGATIGLTLYRFAVSADIAKYQHYEISIFEAKSKPC